MLSCMESESFFLLQRISMHETNNNWGIDSYGHNFENIFCSHIPYKSREKNPFETVFFCYFNFQILSLYTWLMQKSNTIQWQWKKNLEKWPNFNRTVHDKHWGWCGDIYWLSFCIFAVWNLSIVCCIPLLFCIQLLCRNDLFFIVLLLLL